MLFVLIYLKRHQNVKQLICLLPIQNIIKLQNDDIQVIRVCVISCKIQ